MARIEESIEIKRPVDKVFAYTTDAKNWPKWQSVIPEAEQTSQGLMNVGTTFKGVSRMMGRSMKWTAIATEYESNKKWSKNITCGSMAIEEHVIYNPVEGGGTTFTIVYDMKAGGFLKLLSPLMAGSMRKETKKSLVNLKSILEAQTH
jgi:uncharacterized protein YndB with AHSA1/START domain